MTKQERPKQIALDMVNHFMKVVYPYVGSAYMTGDEDEDFKLESSKKESKYVVEMLLNTPMPYNATSYLFAWIKKWNDVKNCIDQITLEDLK